MGDTSVIAGHDMKPIQFIDAADKVLFKAKKSGRNKVRIGTPT